MSDLDNFIYELSQKYSRPQTFYNFVEIEIMKHAGELRRRVKQRIWNKGLDGDLNPLIANDSSLESQEKYKLRKKKRGFRSQPTNLRITGEFYDSFKIQAKKGTVEVVVPESEKSKQLFNKYGEIAIQITQEDADWLLEQIKEPILKWVFPDGEILIEFT